MEHRRRSARSVDHRDDEAVPVIAPTSPLDHDAGIGRLVVLRRLHPDMTDARRVGPLTVLPPLTHEQSLEHMFD